ncbi:MAG: DUF6090 family protein [Pseudomonadota bacterium]
MRDQNWFAVSLDFAIVVVGVFIGIQVANWNEERLNRQEEIVLIARLREDFDRIAVDAERSLAFHKMMTEHFRTVLHSVRSERLDAKDVSAFDQALIAGISIQTSADHSGTFTELMSSGRASILRDRDLLDRLVEYEDFLKRIEFAQHWYMDMIMGALPAYKSAFSYATDMRLTEEMFEEGGQAGDQVVYDFDDLSADPAFEEAVERLLFVHNGLVVWRSRVSSRVDAIKNQLSDFLFTEYKPLESKARLPE